MGFIGLGKIDRNIIPIITGSIFCFLSRLLYRVDTPLFNQKIFPNFLASFGRIFALVPKLISEFRTRKYLAINSQDTIYTNIIKLKYKNQKADITKGKWLYIFLSAMIFIVQGIIVIYVLPIKTNCWIWDILITCFFYYLIFKIKLYKHHYFSMVLIVLIGIFIDLFLGNLQKDITNNFLLLLLRFLREILHSSDYVTIISVFLNMQWKKNIVQNMIYVYTLD